MRFDSEPAPGAELVEVTPPWERVDAQLVEPGAELVEVTPPWERVDAQIVENVR